MCFSDIKMTFGLNEIYDDAADRVRTLGRQFFIEKHNSPRDCAKLVIMFSRRATKWQNENPAIAQAYSDCEDAGDAAARAHFAKLGKLTDYLAAHWQFAD